jgi:hypothetical protein
MTESFVEGWRDLLSEPGATKKEVEYGQPIRLAYGADESGRPVFFSITSSKPGLPDLSNVVTVERGIRKLDGKWTLSLTLRDARLFEVFISLCDDLARRTARALSESQAIAALLEGVAEWKHLLRNIPDNRLSIEGIRGLVAELWFGFGELVNIYSPSDVVSAWTGPLGRPQDFNFPFGKACEVKSRYPDSKSIRISSAEQLDPKDRVLTLAVVTLEPNQNDPSVSVSLRTLVANAEQLLAGSDERIALLHAALDALGVDLLDDYYEDFWFRVVGSRLYSVGESFPSIRASNLAQGIVNVEYSLDLSAVSVHEISEWPT